MKDLFYYSLKGETRANTVTKLKENAGCIIENDDSITVIIHRWYVKMVISLILLNDSVTVIVIRKKCTPFFEKYTVF
ncbi:hypothetical protein [Chryseobacterium sp. WLY505]|uniref:hypothetical protein n=1 Tax=Chryseobacterium sp. WLY505 TaxID=3068892 RepID=UPI0027966835|nr:hypothetical protein [Chryseobacterium sp. WLY505]MDQ1855992.1 hypothetical protein [Chryseobacterium sp. WLY505]